MKIPFLQRKSPFRVGFIAGLAAGIVASAVMLFINVTWHGVSLPEVFGSLLTALMPPPMFEYLHRLIGESAKHILFYGILVGQCFVFALSGALYYSRIKARGDRLHWYHGLLLAFMLWLFAGVILLPLTNAGLFGENLDAGIGLGMLSLAVVGLVFGLLFIVITDAINRVPTAVLPQAEVNVGTQFIASSRKRDKLLEDDPDEQFSRRVILKRGLIVAGIALAGVGVWRFVTGGFNTSKIPVAQLLQHYKSKIVPPPTPNYGTIHPAQFLSPEITSNDQYYVVSKNLYADPTVNGAGWSLTVDGQVEHPFTLNYTQLMALPRKQQVESMMCISNDVGGPYMSNALWEGIPLMVLLQRAGVKPGATKIAFHAVDDYTDSIHLSKALEPTTLLAVRMNGATLPQEHGFPARMLVPGIYGMKHCKWLTRIEVVNYDFQGYWMQRGWDDLGAIRLASRIDTPLDGGNVSVNRTTYIAGVAFSGNKGISEVDVSVDAGQTWQRATLKQPLSGLTWVLWEYAWQPTVKGQAIIAVRTIDMEGNVQNPTEEPPLPKGSSGYHSIITNVA